MTLTSNGSTRPYRGDDATHQSFAVMLVLALTVAACGESPADTELTSDNNESAPGTGEPQDPEATVGDDVEVSPPQAAPGEPIEVTYADGDTGRTGCLALEVHTGEEQYSHVYTLITDRTGGGARSIPVQEWEDCDLQGFTGAEPDGTVLPEDLEPGTYRVCAIGSPDANCGQVEVTTNDE